MIHTLSPQQWQTFTDLLSERMAPQVSPAGKLTWTCHRGFGFAYEILVKRMGLTPAEYLDVVDELKERGARCDCGVLFNIYNSQMWE